MNFKNFQSRSWDDLFSRSLYKLMSSHSFTYDSIHVDFTPENATAFLKSIIDSEGTNAKTLRVRVSFSSKDSTVETITDLITLPLLNEDGIMVNGTKWALINTAHPASGWYIQRNKRGKLELVLQRSSMKVITIRLGDSGSVYVTNRMNKKNKTQAMPLFAFLKAVSCNPNYSYADIADMLSDCQHIMNIYYNEYVNTSKKKKVTPEATLSEAADALLHSITGFPDDYTWADPVGELRKKLKENALRIGEEKIPRFRRFTSFARAKGTRLIKDVRLSNGTIISAGETLTDSVVRLLDSDPSIMKILVEYNELEYSIEKCVPSMELSLEELLCVLRVYDQTLSGLGLEDDPDELYNKVISSIREDYEKRIEFALNKLTTEITRQIASCKGDPVSVLGTMRLDKYAVSLDDVYARITKEPYYQQFDETNSLSSFDQSYKLTTTAKTVADSARDIHAMQYGRICPYTTSESKQVGLNLALTLMSELDQYGFITTPIYKFENGTLADKATYISAIDELTEVIAPANTDLESLWKEHNTDIGYMIQDCRINGQLVSAPLAEVTAKYVSGVQTLGPLPASAPAANTNAPKRLIMCASAQRQALVPLRVERPLVTTGVEALYAIGITTARTMIQDYLMAHSIDEDVSEDARVYYVRAVNTNNTLFVDFELINNDKLYKVTKSFGPCQSTLHGSSRFMRLAPPKHENSSGRYYELDDVVYHNNDIDLKSASFNKSSIDFSTIHINSNKISDHGVAIGNNCKVLFKSFDGYTYEDSIEVTESFLARRGLSVVKTTTLTYKLHKSLKEHVEMIPSEHGNIPQLDANGYPISGYYVQPGQDILAVVSTDASGKTHVGTKKVNVGQSGFIISYKQYQDRMNSDIVVVSIDLGDILDVTYGDKLEGLHGNKGVVGRILKDCEVCYTEDGEVPDIIVNPLGVVARLNLGQLDEFALGGIAQATGEIQILEPFANMSVEEIAALAEKYGIVEKDIYDARTGLKYDKKAMIGNMYMLRLEHTNTSKYNATSDCKNHLSARTGQPQSGFGGGQRMSEMCTWCIMSYGATDTLDTLFTAQSDAQASKHQLDEAIAHREPVNMDYSSDNLSFLQAYFHMLGAHIAVTEDATRVELLTQRYINDTVPDKCNLNSLLNSNATPKAILHDVSVFGKDNDKATKYKRYAQLPFTLDDSCKLIMPIYLKAETVTCMFRYAFYKDNELSSQRKVFHPEMISKIINGTACIIGWTETYQTEEAIKTAFAEQYGLILPDTYCLPIVASTKISRKDISTGKMQSSRNDIVSDQALAEGTGIRAIVNMFEKYDLRYSLCSSVSGKAYSPRVTIANKKEFPYATDIVLFLKNYTAQDFIVTGMLVPPVGYRNVNEMDKRMSNPIDAKLNDIVNSIRLLNSTLVDSERARRETELYKALNAAFFDDSNPSNPSIKDQLVNHKTKTSVMRDTLLSKRLSYTGRSVISIGSDLEFGECGIPICMLTTIFESHIAAEIADTSRHYMLRYIGNMVEHNDASYFKRLCQFIANNNVHGFQNYTLDKIAASHKQALSTLAEKYNSATGKTIKLDTVKDLFDLCNTQLVNILEDLLKAHPALLNREPSLFKFSIQGFKVKPIDSYAIQLHPLNCHGFNGDFDGDQMAALFPMHEKGITDVKSKMMSVDNIIDPKDGSGIIALNQDIILGLYYATIHKNNDLKYNPEEIKAVYRLPKHTAFTSPIGKSLGVGKIIADDIFAGILHTHDTIMCVYDGRKYIAEAGRFIVNALLPGGLGFTTKPTQVLGYSTYELAINYVLTKKTIGKAEDLCINYFSRYGLKEDDTGDSLGAAYNRFMHVGFKMADLSGITISIYDLASLPVKDLIQEPMADVDHVEAEVNDWFSMGFCTEDDKDSYIVNTWQKTVSSLKDMLKNEFKSGSTFDRNSNIFMIVDSGARGDVPQLLEMAGVVGVVTNSAGKALATPVRRSYMDGLTSEQFMQNAYTGRRQTTAAQLTTARAGDLTRHCVYLNEHLHIRPDDQRCDAKSTWIKLDYEPVIDRRALDERVVLNVEELSNIPEDELKKSDLYIFNGESVKYKYIQFLEQCNGLIQSTVVSDEFLRLLTLCKQTFYFSKNSAGEYHFVPVTFKLADSSRSILYYRVLDFKALEENPTTTGYATVWKNHAEHFVGAVPERLGDDIVIGNDIINDIEVACLNEVPIFTILGCNSTNGICRCCYGVKYDSHAFPSFGESIGYQAVQAIGNPITQMILDSHKSDVSNEESAESKLNGILNKSHTCLPNPSNEVVKALPFAAEDGIVTVEKVDSEYMVNIKSGIQQTRMIHSLADLNVAPNSQVHKGEAVCSVPAAQYAVWMGFTDSINIQIEIWHSLCNCFKNEMILARNFEVFARSLTEFGCAEDTDLEHGIVRNSVYRISYLNKYGIKYVPAYLNMKLAMNKSGKILANIALANACNNIVSAVVTGEENTSDSNVGSSLIGDYRSAKKAPRSKSIVKSYPKDRTGLFNDTLIENTVSLLEERREIASDEILLSDSDETESETVYDLINQNSDFTSFSDSHDSVSSESEKLVETNISARTKTSLELMISFEPNDSNDADESDDFTLTSKEGSKASDTNYFQ